MKIHLCKEKPCPLQEKELAKRLNSGFSTSYTDYQGDPLISTNHSRVDFSRVTPPGYSNWEEQGNKYGYFNYYKGKQ